MNIATPRIQAVILVAACAVFGPSTEAATWKLHDRVLHGREGGDGLLNVADPRMPQVVRVEGNRVTAEGAMDGRPGFRTTYEFQDPPAVLTSGQSFTLTLRATHENYAGNMDFRNWVRYDGPSVPEGNVQAHSKRWHLGVGMREPRDQTATVQVRLPEDLSGDRLNFFLESGVVGSGQYWVNWRYRRVDDPSPQAAPVPAPATIKASGRIAFVEGTVKILRERAGEAVARAGDPVGQGDRIESGPDGSFVIEYHESGNVVTQGPNSTFVVVEAGTREVPLVAQVSGTAHWIHRNGPPPTALLGQDSVVFQGTEVFLAHQPRGDAEVWVGSGSVRALRSGQAWDIIAGQRARLLASGGIEGPIALGEGEFQRRVTAMKPAAAQAGPARWQRCDWDPRFSLDVPADWSRYEGTECALLMVAPGSEESRATCAVVGVRDVGPEVTLDEEVETNLRLVRENRQDVEIERQKGFLAGVPAERCVLRMTLPEGRRVALVSWSLIAHGRRYNIYAQCVAQEFDAKRAMLEAIVSTFLLKAPGGGGR